MSDGIDLHRFKLADNLHGQIFREEIVPHLLTGPVTQVRPVVVFVAGQPGAGKTATADMVKTALAQRGEAAHICGDFYKPFHPDYARLLIRDDRTAGAYTRLDTRAWQALAEEYIREQRFDTIVETAMADPEEFALTTARFRAAGYRVETAILAVGQADSRLGILDRYRRQIAHTGGPGRFVTRANHDSCYNGMLRTAQRLDTDHLADLVLVMRRGNTVLYSNRLVGTEGERQWASPPATSAAIEQERSCPWTLQATARFQQRLAVIAAVVGTHTEAVAELVDLTRIANQGRSPARTAGLFRPRPFQEILQQTDSGASSSSSAASLNSALRKDVPEL